MHGGNDAASSFVVAATTCVLHTAAYLASLTGVGQNALGEFCANAGDDGTPSCMGESMYTINYVFLRMQMCLPNLKNAYIVSHPVNAWTVGRHCHTEGVASPCSRSLIRITREKN